MIPDARQDPQTRGRSRRQAGATTVKKNTTILHSRNDDVVPFHDSEELVANSSLPTEALAEIGNDHRLADPEPLRLMLEACERTMNRESR